MPKPSLSLPVIATCIACAVVSTAPAIAGEPTALIEDVSGADADLHSMDYVTSGQTIDLGADGRLVVSYFDSCKTETITGGKVTIGLGASTVENGQLDAVEAACQGSGIALAENTQGAAGVVFRVAAFKGEDWDERTINGERPVFRWRLSDDTATLVIHDMDQDPPQEVWRNTSRGRSLTYPPDAPPLEVGVPYRAQLTLGGDDPIYAVFSIDPGLEGPDSVLSRLVPIRPKRAQAGQ